MSPISTVPEYEAWVLRASIDAANAGHQFVDDDAIIVEIVTSQDTPIKRQDIIDKFSLKRNVDKTVAAVIVARCMVRLVKKKKVEHIIHGYYGKVGWREQNAKKQ